MPANVIDYIRTEDAIISYTPGDGRIETYVVRDASDALVTQNAEAICRRDGKPTDAIRIGGAELDYGRAKPHVYRMICR